MDQNTIIEQLSSTFHRSLSFLETPEFDNIKNDLSSLTHTVTSLEQEVTSMLSAIPINPYERLKLNYFGPDYEFKTLENLEEPDLIPCEECINYLGVRNKEILSTSFHNLTCCDEERVNTGFSFMSGGTVMPDHERQKRYIEFLEIARSIPIESVNQDNYMTIAKKLIGEYMKFI
jgi:hypothetical protein